MEHALNKAVLHKSNRKLSGSMPNRCRDWTGR
uniref:Uncharacterized protein n=1 Tax=Picea glauca TaxID=3330 RepID=A0A101LVW1_PICGL|nr:hypothetical protein ABT39_MTgene1822 [Picea glauca]